MVSFEFLTRFNERKAAEIVNKWLDDDSFLTYNLAVRLLYHVSESSWPPGHQKGVLAELGPSSRVFVDIAMMYSDLLFTNRGELEAGQLTGNILSTKVQPGITYYKVLRAFAECDPLRDSEDDILRLYSDLCSRMGIPSMEEMIDRLQQVLASILQAGSVNKSPSRHLYEFSIGLLEEKKKRPQLFLREYATDMSRERELSKFVDRYLEVSGVEFYKPRKDVPAVILDIFHEFANQTVHQSEITCPVDVVSARVKRENGDRRNCSGTASGDAACTTCFVGRIVDHLMS